MIVTFAYFAIAGLYCYIGYQHFAEGKKHKKVVEHPDVARNINNTAANRLAEAELLMERTLANDEQSNWAEQSNTAPDLSNVAQFLKATNRLAGAKHPNIAIRLNNLVAACDGLSGGGDPVDGVA